LEFSQGFILLTLISRPLGPEMVERLGGIFGGHLQQLLLLAPARHFEGDIGPPLAFQPIPDDHQLVHIFRQQNFRRNSGRLVIKLLQEGRHDLGILFPGGAFQDKVVAANQLSTANKENLNAGIAIGPGKSNHILIGL
jgi:hypothetical protein